jgi:predicted signal transduction protein with EAL and GGDEF domain
VSTTRSRSGNVPAATPAGVAVAGGGETADEVIGNADLAMYQAKHAGRGRYETFEPAMRVALHARLALRSDLERGLAAGEFVPYYLPLVDLASRCIIAVEAHEAHAWEPIDAPTRTTL